APRRRDLEVQVPGRVAQASGCKPQVRHGPPPFQSRTVVSVHQLGRRHLPEPGVALQVRRRCGQYNATCNHREPGRPGNQPMGKKRPATGLDLSGKWVVAELPSMTARYLKLTPDPHVLIEQGKPGRFSGEYQFGAQEGSMDIKVVEVREGGMDFVWKRAKK